MSAVSFTQTGHPITRVATLPSTNVNTVVLVCAGGSSVSVQPAPRWLTNSASAPSETSSGAASHLRHAALEGDRPFVRAEAGKGADALLSAVQQWSATRRSAGHTLSGSIGDGAAASVDASQCSSPASSLAAEQRSSLRGGEVTSLCVAALPGTDTSIAVVGSTIGTVGLFLLEGSRTLCKVAECALARWSHGRITAQDAVVDVAFSMDPAGRPEFVSAASAGCVVLVDVQRLYRNDEHDDGGDGDGAAMGRAEVENEEQRSADRGDTAWSASALRAKAVEALEQPNTQHVRRSRSDVFTCAFAEANVVRVLAPQRLHAAVAMDVALVIVLSDGTLHYVERVVEGGAVRLLAEHHRVRFAKGAAFIAYGQESWPSGSPDSETSASRDASSRALPHVVYRYRLSSHHINVCQVGAAGHGGGSGGGGGGFAGSASAASEWVTLLNDAALYFSEKDGVCHVAVAGTQLVPGNPSAGRHASPVLMDIAAGAAAGWTLGRTRQHGGPSTTTSQRALGFWAVVHNAVLPRCTFDRAGLERQAFQHLQRSQQDASTPQASANAFAASCSTDAGSPFMIHVQSNTMALPAAPLSVATASPSGGRRVSSTVHAGASASYEGVPTSPTISSPTGTGAHAAAGSTTGGVGNGFASVAVVADVLVLSAGADVYVGDVREVAPSAKSLPTLRPARSFGAVVEALAGGSYRDARSVLVAAGSCVVPVTL